MGCFIVVLYLFYSCSPHFGLPSGVWHGVMFRHGQGWGNRTTGIRCPAVCGAAGRPVACIALGGVWQGQASIEWTQTWKSSRRS